MAEVSIVVRAKDAFTKTMAGIGGKLKSFGASAYGIGKQVAKAFAIMGGAVAGAMAAAGKRSEEFNKQIGQIATLTDISTGKIAREVRAMSAEFGLAKDALTKGLYDALSAGVPKDNVFEFMRTASKAAIAGGTDTAKAVDILTTAMNAFKIPVQEADGLSDALFTTVRLGKTTLEELSSSFAQVGPIAAASGVDIRQVLAATATLTKQGTPTAQAMTQIRAAIIAMNETLGDGWSKTMTLQEGMNAMAAAAGGSTSKLKEMTGRVEGTMAILGLTGQNAAGAANDLNQLASAAGATNDAFGKMDKATVIAKTMQVIDNIVLKLGNVTLAMFGGKLTELTGKLQAFSENGYIELWAENANTAIQEMLPTLKSFMELVISATQKFSRLVKVTSAGLAIQSEKEKEKGGFRKFLDRTQLGAFLMVPDMAKSFGEASAMIGEQDRQQAAHNKKRLAEIQARKDAEDQSAITIESSQNSIASAVQTTGEAEAEVTEAKEEQVEVSEKALDVAEKELEVAEKKLEVAKEEAEVMPVIQQAKEAAAMASFAGAERAEPRYQYDLSAGAIQSSSTNTGLGKKLAARAEADRISTIIKALQGDGGGEQIVLLKDIASTNKKISDTIAGQITMG